jgi:16S rRNA (adenine1518-N6/adenine1519-N6)-dimethyltransferase
VRLRVREQCAADVADEPLLWQLVSAGFAQRRKTIYNNLRSAPATLAERIGERGGAHAVLAAAELDSQRRAETFTLTEWSRLTRALGQ